jgi:hypothetical protein
MNIARALGDKFLKGQDVGLSAHPHVSRVQELGPESRASLVMARSARRILFYPRFYF